MNKASVFIGSSSEGLEFARAIRAQLRSDAEISLWNEGFFKVGSTFIESLVNALPRFDFAILLLTGDDLVKSRSDENLGPRDNVIFELGLFMGRLGRDRTFIVHQADAEIKIPTDLSGVATAQYEWPRQDRNYNAAVGSACDEVRGAIRDLGVAEHRLSKRIQAVTQEQQKQADDINRLIQLLVELAISSHERSHLQGLVSDGPFFVDISKGTRSNFQAEIRRLVALRLIGQHPGTTVSAFFSNEARRNAKEFFFITDTGREYLRFYERVTSQPQI